jgi:hypothetical protein
MKVTVSPSSAAFMVTMSSLPAHFKILARLPKLMPAQQQQQEEQQEQQDLTVSTRTR